MAALYAAQAPIMSSVAESVEPGTGSLVMSAAQGLAVADRLSNSIPFGSQMDHSVTTQYLATPHTLMHEQFHPMIEELDKKQGGSSSKSSPLAGALKKLNLPMQQQLSLEPPKQETWVHHKHDFEHHRKPTPPAPPKPAQKKPDAKNTTKPAAPPKDPKAAAAATEAEKKKKAEAEKKKKAEEDAKKKKEEEEKKKQADKVAKLEILMARMIEHDAALKEELDKVSNQNKMLEE